MENEDDKVDDACPLLWRRKRSDCHLSLAILKADMSGPFFKADADEEDLRGERGEGRVFEIEDAFGGAIHHIPWGALPPSPGLLSLLCVGGVLSEASTIMASSSVC